MASEEQLSPEEKLLKVIQAPDGQKQKPAEPAPAQAAASEAASKPQAVPPVWKLKPEPEPVKPQPAPAVESKPAAEAQAAAPVPASAAAQPAAQAPGPASEQAGAVPSGSMSDASWIRHANRVLGVIAAAMVILVAYECWCNAEAVRERQKFTPQRGPRGSFGPEKAELPALDGLVAMFEKGPAFQDLQDGVGATGRADRAGAVALTGWREYAQKNLDLIGMAPAADPAGREAIMVDRQQKRMHVVKAGDRIMVEGKQVEVVSVGQDDVTLTDGGAKLVLK